MRDSSASHVTDRPIGRLDEHHFSLQVYQQQCQQRTVVRQDPFVNGIRDVSEVFKIIDVSNVPS